MEPEQHAAWEPNQEFLGILTGMGIPNSEAVNALFCTGNLSVEAAASYVFDNPDLMPMPPSQPKKKLKQKLKSKKNADDPSAGESQDSDPEGYYKMVFVVNSALNMGTGKVCAQVAHACLGLYRELVDMEGLRDILVDWEMDGEKKIVVRGLNHIHLQELQKMAEESQIHSYLVQDAGRTQVPPNSMTVLGLFGEINKVDNVSGELALL